MRHFDDCQYFAMCLSRKCRQCFLPFSLVLAFVSREMNKINRMNRYSRWLLFGLILLGSTMSILAQRTVSGKVLDAENGDPLIGANVIIGGTLTGTVVDYDGNFSLEVPEDTQSLTITYTGYKTTVLDITGGDSFEVKLESGSYLDEVVVIGYGTIKQEDATGSVASVSAEDFNKGAIASTQDLLVGKIAGVQVTTADGQAGAGATIRIRGGSSLSASNDPLVVIDGIPVDNVGLSGSRNIYDIVNPNDIETFTVLKDASATAIYGSRASNGVILITTKKGALGQGLRVSYEGKMGFSNPFRQLDVLTADEYRTFVTESFGADHPAVELLGDANTDWQDEIYEQATTMDHYVSLSGDIAELIPYRVSLGYFNQDGTLLNDNFQRNSAAINLSPKFFNNELQVNLNIKGAKIKNRFADAGAIGGAVNFDPTQPVLDPESPYEGYFAWTNVNGDPNTIATKNPVSILQLKENIADITRLQTSLSLDYRLPFMKNLRANLNLARDWGEGDGTTMTPATAESVYDPADPDGGGENNTYGKTKSSNLLETYLNYSKEVRDNDDLDLMVGYSWQRFHDEEWFNNSNIAGTDTSSNLTERELFLVSFFGRANYSINDRILLTATLRRDGTSRFSPDARWGLFPAAAVAVKVIDNNETSSKFNQLKVRLGWGITGQQDVGGYYLWHPRYLYSFDNAQYQLGDSYYTTIRPEGYDANIKWEETATWNAGIDYGFAGDRIYGALDVYLRKTSDLINFIPVAQGTNLTNFINTNIGDLENKGLEFSINFVPVETVKSYLDIGFNMAYNSNEITKLTATDDPDYLGVATGGISGGVGNNIQIHSVGFPANSFYVYEQVYDAAGNPIEGEYVDRNGDGQVSPEDLYRYESSRPTVTFGINTTYRIGNFDLSAAGHGSMGNYVYNNIQSEGATINRIYGSTGVLYNAHSDVQELNFANTQYFSDHFVQDASFFRMDHVTVGYNFGTALKFARSFKVYATLQNFALFTGYSGLDPEVFNGIDGNIYPRSRTLLFGVNASF